jgi:hypothetical protein
MAFILSPMGFLMIAAGLGLAGTGVRLSLGGRRPRDLGGMLLAPAGLFLAYLGVARWLGPGFLGG